MFFLWKWIFLLCSFTCGNGAKILGIFICPSYSHQIVFQSIYRELSRRGHEVIVVSPNPLRDPSLTNLTEIDTSYLYQYQTELIDGFVTNVTYAQVISHATYFTNMFMEDTLKNSEFRQLYKNAENEHFDLVLVEGITQLIPAFGHVFNAPSIGVYSMDAHLDRYTSLGGIIHPALYGGILFESDYPISIWQKLKNVYNFLWHKFYIKYINEPAVDKITKEYFGNDFPSIAELERNISMLFVTINKAIYSVRPMPPNIIQLDFMHLQKPKTLPKDLQQVLNDSTHGAVYFSLGSNVKSSTLPASIKKAIIEGLSNLPYTVLWKWESDDVPGMGDNIITRKWFPQQHVLAHPNIKVFVTQGGMQSSDEAIFSAVPMVGIPVIADQMYNIKKLVKLGVALQLSLYVLTSENLKQAIIEVAENKTYSKRMKEISDLSLDQPMTGLERAVWWSEYVIRHKGAPFLRSAIADVPLYEYLLLDVIAVILVGLAVSYYALKRVTSTLYKILFDMSEKEKLS